jgi:hypothetical protein
VAPPRSRLSPSPGVGRGGDRLPESRLSPSPGVGRGGDRRPESRLSLSPGVGRRGDRRLEVEVESEPWGRARRRPSSGGRGRVRALGSGEAEIPMAPEAGLGCCQPHPSGWHSSWSSAGGAVFLSGQLVEGQSDCNHFGLVDWKARVRIRCKAILALRRSGQGCFSGKPARTGPRASRRCVCCLRRPSGEARICLGLSFLLEAGLG